MYRLYSKYFLVKGADENCYFFNDYRDLNKLKSFLKKAQKTSFKKKLFIVGGGPSGIELACKIKDKFLEQFEINLIEKSNEILNKNKIFNREQAEKALEKRKINVLLNSIVKEVSESKISISSEVGITSLDKDIVIWTAGVKPNLSYLETDQITKKFGRILVNNNLQIENIKTVLLLAIFQLLKEWRIYL